MARTELTDRRLLDRRIRKGEILASSVQPELDALPDMAANGEFASPESVQELADGMADEKTARDARIERAIAEPALPDPPIRAPAVPIDLVD